jgi:transcriptional regulator with XRE-family HTH domain
MTFGEIIARGRKRAGLTLKDVAARVRKDDGEPISLTYLNDIEHNRRPAPPLPILKQLADALDLSYDYLVYQAHDLPEDVYDAAYSPEAVEAAFRAFRRVLREYPRGAEREL